jgi:hypothetical protein
MSVTEPNVRAIQAKVYDIPETDKLVGLNPSGDAIEFPEVISFNYYESLFESFITADITILDSAGAVDEAFDKCGVRQFCPVTIEFSDPSKVILLPFGRSTLSSVSLNFVYGIFAVNCFM